MRFDRHLQDRATRRREAADTAAGGRRGPGLRASGAAPAGRVFVGARTATGATDSETRFFLALGIGRPAITTARAAALRNATTTERELLAAGIFRPKRYYETLAKMLGLPFLATIAPEEVVRTPNLDAVLRRPQRLALRSGGELREVVAPTAENFADLMQRLDAHPHLRRRLAVAEPASIRRAVWAARAGERSGETVRRLSEQRPSDSARTTVTGRQGFVAGLLFSAMLGGALVAPGPSAAALHGLLSCLFFSCVVLRLAAFAGYRRPVSVRRHEPARSPLPVYTVVVALHDEARIAGQLVAALNRLKWPRSLLDIKLICEADDAATIGALEALDLSQEYEIVRVPAIGPRTKPKALDYALAGARGDFLVIYDAEDRPHPDQLGEAHGAFAAAGPDLAMVQAPLVVSNARASVLSAVFAMEYGGLFRGLLPFLARYRLPMPLGGTSNHFRIDALMAVGAWDPHNVTEDADLGMRLYRRGYRGGVIARATQEEAPDTLKVWMRQRTRWFKGWLQTWLVLMRRPLRLWREMGPAGFVAFQVLIAGMLVSALGHPLLFWLIGSGVVALADGRLWGGTPLHEALWAADIVNFVGGYLGFVLLAKRTLVAEEKRRVGWRWVWVPL